MNIIDGSKAYELDLELERIAQANYAFRSGGSKGATETAIWLKSQFESFGLQTSLERFEFKTWDINSNSSLTVDEDSNFDTVADQFRAGSFQPVHLSWPTAVSGVIRDLVVLPLPTASGYGEIGLNSIDMTIWNSRNVSGKIVLIGREVTMSSNWLSTYESKISQQHPAGLIYTWWYSWMNSTSSMFDSAEGKNYWTKKLPVGNIDYDDGLSIRQREAEANVTARVVIDAEFGTGPHYNVVARLPGFQEPDKCVLITSHYDSVMTAGFCDNGAGTAGVLELARALSYAVQTGLYKPKFTVLFISFTDEEWHLAGSINYIKAHEKDMPNIIAVVNLDCIGSDNLHITHTDSGSLFDLDQLIAGAANSLSVPYVYDQTGSSDQQSFLDPSWANDYYYSFWDVDIGIANIIPIPSSSLLYSGPLYYYDLWRKGTPGWIHTPNDSSSTSGWIEIHDLTNHIKIAALSLLRISPDTQSPNGIAILKAIVRKTTLVDDEPVQGQIILANRELSDLTVDTEIRLGQNASTQFSDIFLPQRSYVILDFQVSTLGYNHGAYPLTVYATHVRGELNVSDDTYFFGDIVITVLGDVDGSMYVGMSDIARLCLAIGLEMGEKTYAANLDLNFDGKIEIADLTLVLTNFGKAA